MHLKNERREVIKNKFINSIVYGNSYEIVKEIPDSSVDLVVMDPPYQLSKKSKTNPKNRLSRSMHSLYQGFESADIMDGISFDLLDDLMRVMRKPNIYIWCNKKQIINYLEYFVVKHNCSFEILVWIKTNPIPLYGRNYMNDKEYCLYFKKGVSLHTTYKTGKTYLITQTNKKDKLKYNHPTVKPEEIIESLVLNSSSEGDIVLDCFLGSGTTAVVAKRLGRKYIGIEKDSTFYTTAVDRVATQ